MRVIKGKNFILRPLKMSDAKAIAEIANDKDVSRGLEYMPYPYKLGYAVSWLKKSINENKKKVPKHIRFAVEIEGEFAGQVGFNILDEKNKTKAELGYWLGKKHWGQGITTEIVKQIIRLGFNDLGFIRIYAHVFPFNKASMHVLTKNGFKQEGILRKDSKKNGKFLDHYLFAKVK